MTRGKLRAIDLFAGCGGLTEGLRRAEYDVIGAVELHPVAARTYTANHPDVKLFRNDITGLSATRVMRELGIRKGELDLLAGCPPCQGFSTLTTRNGNRRVDDPRNLLILDFLRFVRKLRPRAVMLENVPALGTEELFATFCAGLRAMGYSEEWRILNVADFGVPQRRRRLILVALLEGAPVFASSTERRLTVRDAIADLPAPGATGDALHDIPERRSEHVKRLIAAIPRDGGSRKDLPPEDQLPCHQRCDGFKDVYGRMRWNDVAPTITSGCHNPSKGRFLHPEQDRCITLREAALLQSFPRRYRFDILSGKEQIALMIGNALPPAFVERHGRRIARELAR